MRTHSLISPIWESFYSRSLYRDVARNWNGSAFAYLFILMIICLIPFTYKVYHRAEAVFGPSTSQFVNQLPVVTIKNGEMSIDKPAPYFIREPSTHEVVAVFDPTGKFSTLTKKSMMVLVTKTQIIYRTGDEQSRIFNLSTVKDTTFGPANVSAGIEKLKHWGILLLYPLLVVMAFVYRVIQSLLYGLIGLFFSLFTKAKITYGESICLSIIAATPSIILSTVLNYFDVSFPGELLLYFVVSMAYLYCAIRWASDKAHVDAKGSAIH